ncbi:MAG: hypothetical protein KDB90_16495 [Planctomycetes bacterium]|nr:hypothetical protein [Planctomycetota bacterium]
MSSQDTQPQPTHATDWRATAHTHYNPSNVEEVGLFTWLFRIAFTALVVGLAGLSVIVVVLVLFGPSGQHDSRRSEGEQLMGSARDFLRVEYSKNGSSEATREPFRHAVAKGEFTGKYFSVSGDIVFNGEGGTIHTEPGQSYKSVDGTGYMTWDWRSGNSLIDWR